jgi:hypothetical protein
MKHDNEQREQRRESSSISARSKRRTKFENPQTAVEQPKPKSIGAGRSDFEKQEDDPR